MFQNFHRALLFIIYSEQIHVCRITSDIYIHGLSAYGLAQQYFSCPIAYTDDALACGFKFHGKHAGRRVGIYLHGQVCLRFHNA